MYSPDRLLHPLKRTNPKDDPNPGWERIGWDEALDMTAAAMRRIAEQYGPEAVAFSQSSPSTTALADSGVPVLRIGRHHGGLLGNYERLSYCQNISVSDDDDGRCRDFRQRDVAALRLEYLPGIGVHT